MPPSKTAMKNKAHTFAKAVNLKLKAFPQDQFVQAVNPKLRAFPKTHATAYAVIIILASIAFFAGMVAYYVNSTVSGTELVNSDGYVEINCSDFFELADSESSENYAPTWHYAGYCYEKTTGHDVVSTAKLEAIESNGSSWTSFSDCEWFLFSWLEAGVPLCAEGLVWVVYTKKYKGYDEAIPLALSYIPFLELALLYIFFFMKWVFFSGGSYKDMYEAMKADLINELLKGMESVGTTYKVKDVEGAHHHNMMEYHEAPSETAEEEKGSMITEDEYEVMKAEMNNERLLEEMGSVKKDIKVKKDSVEEGTHNIEEDLEAPRETPAKKDKVITMEDLY